MVGLYKDPEGETIFDKINSNSLATTANNSEHGKTIQSLRSRVMELESIIATRNEVYRQLLVI